MDRPQFECKLTGTWLLRFSSISPTIKWWTSAHLESSFTRCLRTLPFAQYDAYEAARKFAKEKCRPEFKSKYITEDMIKLIQHCWQQDPADRPEFQEIIKELESIKKISFAQKNIITCGRFQLRIQRQTLLCNSGFQISVEIINGIDMPSHISIANSSWT